MKKVFLLLLAGGLAVLIAGCTSSSSHTAAHFTPLPAAAPLNAVTLTNELAPDLLHPAPAPFTLGPGDIVDIEIVGNRASRALAQVGPDGKIYYYLLPGLDVWGLTLTQATDLLEKELAKLVNAPQVSVTLREVGSKYVWLLGRLNKPGIYPMTGPTTLLESIALAGGTARSSSQFNTMDLADLRHSFVARQGQFLPVDFYRLLHDGDTSQNIVMQPDDFVFVRSALSQEVYILGAVRNPRVVPYLENMTLVAAIAGGSGPMKFDLITGVDNGPMTRDAYLSHVAIVRGSLAEPQLAVVNYNDIIKGRAPDVLLEPGDIIFIPTSPYTTLKRYFNLIVNTFVTTVAANEGVRAGGGKVGVGVSVPIGK